MKLTHEDHGQTTVLNLRGELTAEQTESFRKAIHERLSADIRDVVLNLSAADFIDSKGLETLLWLQDEVSDRLGQVRLACLSEDVKTILDITRLSGRFECYPDVQTARESLG